MAGEAKSDKEKVPRAEGEKGPEKPPEKVPEKAPKKKLTKAEKQAQHMDRLKKTAVACLAGVIAGVLAFYVDSAPPGTTVAGTALGILFVLAAIVFQKYIFFALKMDYLSLTAKDWVFQGFMTTALWFITWTLLLSTG